LTRKLSICEKPDILDVGCGLGFTVDALSKLFPQGKVHGVDVSEDAISYAKIAFPNASFSAVALSPDSEDIGRFDCIFCIEFYPFTRTDDYLYQSRIINYLARQLKINGKIILYQRWDSKESVVPNIERLKARCVNLIFAVDKIPHPKIPLWLPVPITNLCASLISLLGREGFKRFLVIRKEST
jgi:SAM-dependent methyltransferase